MNIYMSYNKYIYIYPKCDIYIGYINICILWYIYIYPTCKLKISHININKYIYIYLFIESFMGKRMRV